MTDLFDPTSRNFMRAIRATLQSVRMSLERPFFAARRNRLNTTLFRDALLAVESVRISAAALEDEKLSEESLVQLIGELRDLAANHAFLEFARSLPFRAYSPQRDTQRTFGIETLRGLTVEDAVRLLIDRIEAEAGLAREEILEFDAHELRRVVPAQKIAPAQFDIKDERLVVIRKSSAAAEEDRENVGIAKAELEGAGERILDELARSNCDRRLIDTVRRLQDELKGNTNIVALGITNLTCEAMCNVFHQELPDAVGAMLRAQTRGIELYVGQFPEWHRFVENAATIELTQQDVSILKNAASELASRLEQRPDIAEPEVPQTIKRINELLQDPGRASKRAGFAMLRTLENLISKVFEHSADFIESTMKKTKEKVSGVIAYAAAVVLLKLALESAVTISPVTAKITETQWIRTAIELVQRQINKIGD